MNRKLLDARKAALDAIAKKHGGVLRPKDVVKVAADPEHILHDIFEWDDSKAAYQHRLSQARDFIASVRYVYIIEEHTYSAPEWVRDPRLDTEQGYASMGKLLSDKDLAREALANEFARAGAHLSRAYDISRALKFRPADVKRLADRVETLAQAFQGSG